MLIAGIFMLVNLYNTVGVGDSRYSDMFVVSIDNNVPISSRLRESTHRLLYFTRKSLLNFGVCFYAASSIVDV